MKPTREDWRNAAMLAVGAVVAAAALVVLDLPGADLVRDALGPVAAVPEASPDDYAGGDALAADDNGERFLPVPGLLDDDRVTDALAPLANLACRRDDPQEAPGSDPNPVDALNAPLASYSSATQQVATGPLVAAAVAPIAPVTASSPEASREQQVAANDMPADCPPLLRHQFNRLQTGEAQSLCQFRGKVLLVVNTASYCGYTGQYEGLEALYRKYKGRGLVVVGFPSNDFGGQEPGTNQEIAQFCRLTYGVQFPMFEKSSVTKVGENPLFASLSASTGVSPTWNFFKYLVDRNGQGVAAYPSRTTPSDPEFVRTIERLLAEKPQA